MRSLDDKFMQGQYRFLGGISISKAKLAGTRQYLVVRGGDSGQFGRRWVLDLLMGRQMRDNCALPVIIN